MTERRDRRLANVVPPTAPWWSVLAFILAATFLVVVGTYDLRLPGLQYDEAFDAVPILESLQGREPGCARAVALLGRSWPLMIHPHIGPTSAYVALVSFSLFGVSVESLRCSQLAIGVLTLLLLVVAARSWFDDRTAALAVLLCGTSPAFIWWSRAGANWTVPLLPIALAMLLLLVRWWRRDGAGSLVAAAFLLGLGITTKILFVWLLPALALAALLVAGPRRLWSRARSIRTVVHVAAAAALVVGLLPFLIHNVATGDVFRNIRENALRTRYGHDNTTLLRNLWQQARDFAAVLDGDTMLGPGGRAFASAVVLLAVLYTLWHSVRRTSGRPGSGAVARRGDARGLRLLLVLIPLTVLPLSTVSTSGIGATYLFIIVPFVWLLLATVLADGLMLAGPDGSGWRWLRLATVLVLVATLGNNIATNVRLVRYLTATGGRGIWSDSIFAVADTLENEDRGRPVVAMDWGLARSVEFLTQLRVPVGEGCEFAPEPSAAYAEACRSVLREENAVYLVRAPHGSAFPRCWDVCRGIAHDGGKEFVLERTFSERDGVANTFLYSLRPTPVAAPG